MNSSLILEAISIKKYETILRTLCIFEGLKLMLNIQQYQYVSYLTESSGARVVVHDRDVMPFPEQYGLNVAPNSLVEIAVRQVSKRHNVCL